MSPSVDMVVDTEQMATANSVQTEPTPEQRIAQLTQELEQTKSVLSNRETMIETITNDLNLMDKKYRHASSMRDKMFAMAEDHKFALEQKDEQIQVLDKKFDGVVAEFNHKLAEVNGHHDAASKKLFDQLSTAHDAHRKQSAMTKKVSLEASKGRYVVGTLLSSLGNKSMKNFVEALLSRVCIGKDITAKRKTRLRTYVYSHSIGLMLESANIDPLYNRGGQLFRSQRSIDQDNRTKVEERLQDTSNVADVDQYTARMHRTLSDINPKTLLDLLCVDVPNGKDIDPAAYRILEFFEYAAECFSASE